MNIDIESYYRLYAPMVLRRCRFLLRDEELALDVLQEVFAAILRSAERLEHNAPSSLLYTIATNLCLNTIKSQQIRARFSQTVDQQETDFISHDPEYAKFEAREVLDEIFGQDDEKTRTIAWLHYVDKLTLEETAIHMAMSVSGIRKRLRKLQQRGKEMKGVLQ